MKSKMLNVRLDENIVEEMESVRDEERFPTQSDFVREAIRRLVREERREQRRREVRLLARDQDEMARSAQQAEEEFPDLVRRWEQADRGEL